MHDAPLSRYLFRMPGSVATKDKEQKLDAVARAVASLLLSHGIPALTPSRVARAARVSRGWIYKYLGGGDKLIEFAVDRLGKDFAELGSPIRAKNRDELRDALIEGSRRMYFKAVDQPFLLPIYFRYVQSPTPLGERIREIEAVYLRRLAESIRASLGIDMMRAKQLAELLTSLRMSLGFRIPAREPQLSPQSLSALWAEYSRLVDLLLR